MAADSQISDGDQRVISIDTPKIIQVGDYLMGISGDSRPGDILAFNWKPPVYDGTDPVQHMGRKLIPSMLMTLRNNGYEFEKDSTFSYLISFNAKLFSVASDLSFNTSEYGLFTAGSGGPYALGYLYSIKPSSYNTIAPARSVAQKAVKIASVLDINTSGPIQLVIQERVWI